jgi:hypothetical protein
VTEAAFDAPMQAAVEPGEIRSILGTDRAPVK